jgi:N-acetylmuramoyl-L-alanine amidase
MKSSLQPCRMLQEHSSISRHYLLARLVLVSIFLTAALLGLPRYASAQKQPLPLAGVTILLDPGHGGLALGAHCDSVEEKRITLAVSEKVKRLLQTFGAKIYMTRTGDSDVSLEARVDQSIALRPDIFVSVHANANTDRSTDGIETYYFGRRSAPLAHCLLRSLCRGLGERANWAKQDRLFVLHHNVVPSTLVEIGYLSNVRTVALLVQDAYQERAATAIARGIVEYFAGAHPPRGCQSSAAAVALVVRRMKKAVARAAHQPVDRGYRIPSRDLNRSALR